MPRSWLRRTRRTWTSTGRRRAWPRTASPPSSSPLAPAQGCWRAPARLAQARPPECPAQAHRDQKSRLETPVHRQPPCSAARSGQSTYLVESNVVDCQDKTHEGPRDDVVGHEVLPARGLHEVAHLSRRGVPRILAVPCGVAERSGRRAHRRAVLWLRLGCTLSLRLHACMVIPCFGKDTRRRGDWLCRPHERPESCACRAAKYAGHGGGDGGDGVAGRTRRTRGEARRGEARLGWRGPSAAVSVNFNVTRGLARLGCHAGN